MQMKRVALAGVVLLMGGLTYLVCRPPQLDGCYDTTIVGHISEHAFIKIRGTNVFLVDGENAPASFGHITKHDNYSMWSCVGGTKWYLQPTRTTLVCTEVGNPSNRFVLTWVPFNPVIQAFTRIYKRLACDATNHGWMFCARTPETLSRARPLGGKGL